MRVRRIKKAIIISALIFLLLPTIFCIALTFKIKVLEKEIIAIRQETAIFAESINNLDWKQETESEREEETKLREEETMKKVYLTFDDGPGPNTEKILDILRGYDVKATFFVTGMNSPKYDNCYLRILEEGHTLGIHSFSHDYSDIYVSLDSFKQDWLKMQQHIEKLTGEKVTISRFPGGSSNTVSNTNMKEMISWLKEQGVVYYDWNVSAEDAGSKVLTPEQIVTNCIEGIKNYKQPIVLLHDASGKTSTIEALPLIIEGIRKLEDTVLLPIDEDTVPIQHKK